MRNDREYPTFDHVWSVGGAGVEAGVRGFAQVTRGSREGTLFLGGSDREYDSHNLSDRPYIDHSAHELSEKAKSSGGVHEYPVSGDTITKLGNSRLDYSESSAYNPTIVHNGNRYTT